METYIYGFFLVFLLFNISVVISQPSVWFNKFSGTNSALYSVYFTSPSTGYTTGAGGIIRATTDGGDYWYTLYSGTTYTLYDIHFVNQTTGWIVGAGEVIRRTTNTGVNWVTQLSYTSQQLRDVFFINSLTGWTVGLNGIILKSISSGLVYATNISNEIPDEYGLEQNYPNPFNPSIKIKFDIAKINDVKIIVYDVIGRDILTLVNERLQPGTYETTFDGSSLKQRILFL